MAAVSKQKKEISDEYELRLRSCDRHRNRCWVAFADSSRRSELGCPPGMAQPAGLTLGVYGILSSGRNLLAAGDCRADRRHTAQDSGANYACTLDGTHRDGSPVRCLPLRL